MRKETDVVKNLNKHPVHCDKYGPIRLMTSAGGYVMVRRPRCAPFVLSIKEYEALECVMPEQPARGRKRVVDDKP